MKNLICKIFNFDAAHRIWKENPRKNKCANIHGHTFLLEVWLEAQELDENGMVIDTDIIKKIVKKIINPLDHAFIVHVDDPLLKFFRKNKYFKELKIYTLDLMPTAEGISQHIFYKIKDSLETHKIGKKIKLRKVKLKMSNTIISGFEYEI